MLFSPTKTVNKQTEIRVNCLVQKLLERLTVLMFFSAIMLLSPVSQPWEAWFLFLVKDVQRQVGAREAAPLCRDMCSWSFLECLLWNSLYKKSREWPPQIRGFP